MSEPMIVRSSIHIQAPASKVWEALTSAELTKKYMFGCAAISDWQVGSPLLWKGVFNGAEIVAVKGNVVDFQPFHRLAFTTFDPNSAIEDIPENYVTATYTLTEADGGTLLEVSQGDFATVADGERRYNETDNNGQGWTPILVEIKKLVEA